MRRTILAAVLAVGISGCGGGGTASVQPATGTPAQTNDSGGASVVTSITVPDAQGTQSNQRSAQYVSASTLGLKVTVTDVPPTGGTASFTATTSVYALGLGLNKIVVPTPASAAGHSEDLTYVAYNAAPVANAIPSTAKAVGWGLSTGFVVVPGQNSNSVVLSGVVNGFPALIQTGSFGMMSATPPTIAGVQTTLGFGGNAVPNGIATLDDAGGNNITTAAGGPWPVVGALPATATAVATGVPLTIVESAGTCGSVGAAPHLKLADNGGTPAITAAIGTTADAISAIYDGKGGAGWYAVVSAKAQTQTLTYTLSSLAATSTNVDFSCPNQSLSFSASNETAVITIVEHAAAVPYTITEPNTPACTQLVNVYAGNSIAAPLVTPGTPTSLGAGSTFTFQLVASPGGFFQCNVEVQDANAAATGGTVFPGGTTYVAALLPPGEIFITVP